jgi:hypothetical protein
MSYYEPNQTVAEIANAIEEYDGLWEKHMQRSGKDRGF